MISPHYGICKEPKTYRSAGLYLPSLTECSTPVNFLLVPLICSPSTVVPSFDFSSLIVISDLVYI